MDIVVDGFELNDNLLEACWWSACSQHCSCNLPSGHCDVFNGTATPMPTATSTKK